MITYTIDKSSKYDLTYLMKLNGNVIGSASFIKRDIGYLDIVLSEVECYRTVSVEDNLMFDRVLKESDNKPIYYLEFFGIQDIHQKNGYGGLFLDFLYKKLSSSIIILNPRPLNTNMQVEKLITFYNEHLFKTLCEDKDGCVIWKLPSNIKLKKNKNNPI